MNSEEEILLSELKRECFSRTLDESYRCKVDQVECFEIPNFLTPDICHRLVNVINHSLTASQVGTGNINSNLRESFTCNLLERVPEIARNIDSVISRFVGLDAELSEPLQAQMYRQGGFYKPHYDYFDLTERFTEELDIGGQRTHTFMVYLNDVPKGGATKFKKLGLSFRPVMGKAIFWKNLTDSGRPNEFTLHESEEVTTGEKYILTKWFREKPGRSIGKNTVVLNGIEHDVSHFSERQRQILDSLKFLDQEISYLDARLQMTRDARIEYLSQLTKVLLHRTVN